MKRRPPRPTLLPTTTLFGSQVAGDPRVEDARRPTLLDLDAAADLRHPGHAHQPGALGLDMADDPDVGRVQRRAARDRKSTRLNSSYANISYAVFCLKKKNRQ